MLRRAELIAWMVMVGTPLLAVAIPATCIAFGVALWPGAITIAALLGVCGACVGILRCLELARQRRDRRATLAARNAREGVAS